MIAKPYAILALVLLLGATHGAAYLQGFKQGSKVEAARWQAEKIKEQQKAAEAVREVQEALRKREAELRKREADSAKQIIHVRTEFLPAKTVVKREVVKLPADCRIGDGLRDTINSALSGRPVPGGGAPVSAGGDSVSRRTAAATG